MTFRQQEHKCFPVCRIMEYAWGDRVEFRRNGSTYIGQISIKHPSDEEDYRIRLTGMDTEVLVEESDILGIV